MSDQPAAPGGELPPALRDELLEADTLREIAVLYDPPPAVLQAYALEASVGVIAYVSSGPEARIDALEAGALEVLHPEMPEREALLRVQTAVARFRSRVQLEAAREHLRHQHDTMERNLRLAARLQRSFLPRVIPELPQIQFSTAYLPQEFVSGDSYDVRRLDDDHVGVYTLDAVGHGVRPALLTVLLRSIFDPMQADGPRPPNAVISELNRSLMDAKLEESPTAAFCYAVVDLPRARMQVANAGHPLPIRLLPDGTVRRVDGSGLLLGVYPEDYELAEVELVPGERVFFFTDGASPGYDEVFGEQLRLHRDLALEDQVAGALGEVIELDDEGRPEDDVTVVAFEFRGDSGGEG